MRPASRAALLTLDTLLDHSYCRPSLCSASASSHAAACAAGSLFDMPVKYASSPSHPTNLAILHLAPLVSLHRSPLSGQATSHLGHITASQKTFPLCTQPSHANDKSWLWIPLMFWIYGENTGYVTRAGAPSACQCQCKTTGVTFGWPPATSYLLHSHHRYTSGLYEVVYQGPSMCQAHNRFTVAVLQHSSLCSI